ncbi:hypothetical protein NDU88_006889 [Pleurodeles waltl]|uniref:Uncharacterized protein n=1 Tax=Pleurodeles waltl TaxID=8319 RepID=A0AAV7NRL5_PLEWA|nr:hypothetical protein NDU88_006889 [Pleurodeles waltl]
MEAAVGVCLTPGNTAENSTGGATHGVVDPDRVEAAVCGDQGVVLQKTGKTGRKKDAEQKNGASADTMAGPRGTKNTLPEEKNRDPTLQDVLLAITASREAL